MAITAADIRREVKEKNVTFLRLMFSDILGIMKNVEIPATDEQLDKVLSNKVMFDGSSIEGFVRINESDMYLDVYKRQAGNRRMYSLNDMDRLLEIKDFLNDGYNIAAIKHEYEKRKIRVQQKRVALTDADVRRILHDELLQQGRFTTPSQQFGNLRI